LLLVLHSPNETNGFEGTDQLVIRVMLHGCSIDLGGDFTSSTNGTKEPFPFPASQDKGLRRSMTGYTQTGLPAYGDFRGRFSTPQTGP
jgi:hypothetical protein